MVLKIWHIFRGVFSLAGIALCVLILILEIKGLPENMILGLRQQLDNQNLTHTFKDIHIGPVSGLKVTYAQIRDNTQDKTLYSAEEVHIGFNTSDLTRGLLTPESLKVSNAKFNLKLHESGQEEYLSVQNANLNAKLINPQSIQIHNLECTTKHLELSITGSALNIIKSQKEDTKKQSSLPSVDDLNAIIPSHIKKAIVSVNDIAELLNLTDKSALNIDFFYDSLSPQKSSADMQLTLPEFLYNGNLVKNTTLKLTLEKNQINISHIDISADEDEVVSGNLEFDLDEGTIAGELKTQVFPLKYIKIFAPQLLKKLEFIQFRESPPQVNLVIQKSKINDPKNWEINGDLKATNFQIQGLYVDIVEGKFKVRDLNFISETLKLASPQINGQVQVKYTSHNNKVALYAKGSGDPRHISHFIFNTNGRKNYLNVWERFSWGTSADPKWKGYFDYMYDPVRKQNLMTFDGNFQADGASVNGVKTQNLSADVNMQFPEQILINNIRIDTTDRHARGAIGFKNVNTDCTLDYQFYSTLPIPQTLRIANGDWKNLLSSLDLPGESYARITGHLNLSEALDARSEAYIELPYFMFNGMKVESPVITFNMRDKQIVVSSRKAKFYSGNLLFTYQENLNSNHQALKLNANSVDLAGLISQLQKDSLSTAAGRVNFGADLALKSHKGQIRSIIGEGFLNIHDGLFLEIPFLSTFFNRLETILPFVSATQVKELSAELKFFDQQVNVKNFFSDGKLIALSGKGWYDWGQTMYMFNINTHYLKDILRLPKPINIDLLKTLFSPLSVLVKAEVRGNKDGYEWKINSMDNFKNSIKKGPSSLFNLFKKKEER